MSTPSSGRGPGDVDVVGDRIVAQIVDYVVMFVLLIAIGYLGLVASGGSAGAIILLGYLFVGLGYGTLLEGAYGKTIGKMVTDIRVVGRGGREITYGQAFVRNVPALFAGELTWLFGLAAIATDERNQRLFDRPAGTYVVRDTETGPRLTEQRREQFTR